MLKLTSTAFCFLLALSAPSLAEGDVKAGKKVFKKCKACHTVKEGKHKSGPSLFNVVGSQAGTKEEFKYSQAVIDSEIVWDEANLRAFLTKPKDLIPGNKMSFTGLKKEKDLNNIIAYLQSVSEPKEEETKTE